MINKLGFGFLRLPKTGEAYDWNAVQTMVDAYMAGGGSYFDTCYTYLNGQSEEGIRRCVTQRKPRESFQLCDKLPGYLCKSYEDCEKFFTIQQQRCGVEWFDVLMLHWLNDRNYAMAEKLDQFRFLREKKAQGLAKRIGFSFHGDADLLEEILRRHPEVDVVLLQLNYLDWESAGIQSKKCYEVCLRHGKSVQAMEPVKGGTLAKLPEEAEARLRRRHPDWTPADWALRFVQSLPGVEICLSGMNAVSQVEANIRPFDPLTPEEVDLLLDMREIITGKTAIACTQCQYCVSHCSRQIPIPRYIQMYNQMYNELCGYPGEDWKILASYRSVSAQAGKASDCVGCRSCEKHCPQNIAIAEHMRAMAQKLEE